MRTQGRQRGCCEHRGLGSLTESRAALGSLCQTREPASLGGRGVFSVTRSAARCVPVQRAARPLPRALQGPPGHSLAPSRARPAAPSRPQGCPPARLLSPAGALLPSCPPCAAAPPPRARAGHLRPACPPAGPHGGGGRIGAAAVGARQPRRRHSEIGAGRQGTRAPRLRAGSTLCQQGPRAGTRGLEAES